jgi:hypothetical protein
VNFSQARLRETGRETAVEADDFLQLLVVHRIPFDWRGRERNRRRWMLDCRLIRR